MSRPSLVPHVSGSGILPERWGKQHTKSQLRERTSPLSSAYESEITRCVDEFRTAQIADVIAVFGTPPLGPEGGSVPKGVTKLSVLNDVVGFHEP